MSIPGLSLVGFMERGPALAHLRTACIPKVDTDAALEAEWLVAKSQLGSAVPGAGTPKLSAIPSSHQGHVAFLMAQPWYQQALSTGALSAHSFQMVEIAQLLAFQFTVDMQRSQSLCAQIVSSPTNLDELFKACLPANVPVENWEFVPATGQQSILIRSRSLNLRLLSAELYPHPKGTIAGMILGPAVPLVHVVRLNGRCYLHNGFHRACGALAAGATEIPCIFRDVNLPIEANINPGATFDIPLLESANPPTLAHFVQGRAYDVTLRTVRRYLQVSWAEYSMPDPV